MASYSYTTQGPNPTQASYTGYQDLLKPKAPATGGMNVPTQAQTNQANIQAMQNKLSAAQPTAPAPKTTPQPGLMSSQTVSPAPTTSVSIDYTLRPGETQEAYHARIAQARGTQTPQASVPGLLPTGSQSISPSITQPAQQNPSFTGLISSMEKGATEGSGSLQKAREDLAKFLGDAQKARTAALDAPTGKLTGESRVALINQEAAARESALREAVSNAEAEQQRLLGGLGAAAGLVAPSGQYPFVFDPITGQYKQSTGVGGGGAISNPQEVAQALIGGQMTYQQAQQALSYLGGTADSQLNSAIIAAGGNPLQLQAQGAGQQDVLASLPRLESANTAAKGIENQIISYLQSNPGLNTSELAAGNKLQQWIEGKQLADPKYQILFNALDEYTNTLAPILGVGGNPTNLKTEIAQRFINAAASGQSIAEVLKSMAVLADSKLANMRSGATGGGVVSTPSLGGGQNNQGWGWNP